jgi:uncharacterized protein with PIN domain
MLFRLARWLRAAGYDASLAERGEPDAAVLARAVDEHRWLVTRDRALLQRRAATTTAILIDGDTVADQAASLSRAMAERHRPIDWLADPMSRCLVCNVPVIAIDPLPDGLPPGVRARGVPVWQCPSCRRLYWAGGHESRMRRTLERFAHG